MSQQSRRLLVLLLVLLAMHACARAHAQPGVLASSDPWEPYRHRVSRVQASNVRLSALLGGMLKWEFSVREEQLLRGYVYEGAAARVRVALSRALHGQPTKIGIIGEHRGGIAWLPVAVTAYLTSSCTRRGLHCATVCAVPLVIHVRPRTRRRQHQLGPRRQRIGPQRLGFAVKVMVGGCASKCICRQCLRAWPTKREWCAAGASRWCAKHNLLRPNQTKPNQTNHTKMYQAIVTTA
eukprot:352421-Chlamydomonas_euryale.AAC.57